jgi:pSer/pThr/pTyr-binding forkhead associated (FHA) protein
MNENKKYSKFSGLYAQIPKDPEMWTMDDVLVWLQFIGLEAYAQNFADMKVDGLIILDLEEGDLEHELKITTKLHKKKITKAIEVLKEYHAMFRESDPIIVVDSALGKTGPGNNLAATNKSGGIPNNLTRDELTKAQENRQRLKWEDERKNQGPSPKPMTSAMTANPLGDPRQNIDRQEPGYLSMGHPRVNGTQQLGIPQTAGRPAVDGHQATDIPARNTPAPTMILNSIEGNDQLSHTIDEHGAKIGRHSSNKIVIYDESVSRHHAEIFYNHQASRFFLVDHSSTTGTFLKIVDPIELQVENIIEIGSYQLMVNNIVIGTGSSPDEVAINSFVEFTIYESPEELDEKVFCLTHLNSIGRKTTNNLCFSDDLHMSNLHSRLNLVGNKFYFEDMASTNGSWLRLSKENFESGPFMLLNKTIFKIGNSAMLECTYENEMLKEEMEEMRLASKPQGFDNCCSICLDSERDCLIMPCRHSCSCLRCIKSVKNCPVCRTPINDIIRIYRS